MPKVTITLEYDNGKRKSHTAVLPPMPDVELDQMVDDAASQAGYQETVTDDAGKKQPNPKTHFRHLSGWVFKVMASLVSSHRAEQGAEIARKAASDAISTLQDSVKVE